MDINGALNSIEQKVKQIGIPAWGIIITKDHNELLRHVSGSADLEGRLPFTDRHRCWLYSLSKIATATSAVQLIERGRLKLTDNVADYLPSYSNPMVLEDGKLRPAKRPITVLDLFTMRGGYDYDSSMLEGATGEAGTNEALINAIAAKPLLFDPGEQFNYSLCHDVLGGVIAAASGMAFKDWLYTELFMPLQMTETRFAPRIEEYAPYAEQYRYENGAIEPCGLDNHYAFSEEYCSGGAGLMTTLSDYIKLIDALANEGTGANGARILTPQSVALMDENRLVGAQLQQLCSWRPGYGYGLGVRTRLQDESNPKRYHEFGWDGAAGSYALCDRGNRLAILYIQHVLNCGPAYDELHPFIRDTVYEALGL